LEVLLWRPAAPRAWLALTHGAGTGIRHRFFGELGDALASERIGTACYELPYRTRGARRPDPAPRVHAAVAAAFARTRALAGSLPCFAGGKSFGGRMTSQAAAAGLLPGARGIVLLGFPLHPPGRPGTARADHLAGVPCPVLFVQGTRDDFAPLETLAPLVTALPRATLRPIVGADHGFARRRRDLGGVPAVPELVEAIARFVAEPG
jgi:hypothetical protein